MKNTQVVACGGFSFEPKNEWLPLLPEMQMIIIEHFDNNGIYTHSAICIELEIDAVGNSEEEAVNELKNELDIYLKSLLQRSESVEDFAKTVTNIAFSKSRQKEELYTLYQNYLLDMVQKAEEFAKTAILAAFSKSRQKEELYMSHQNHLLDMMQKEIPSLHLTKKEAQYGTFYTSLFDEKKSYLRARV